MELISVASVIGFIALFVIIPAVWRKDPDRRACTLEALRMILSAFGRRQCSYITGRADSALGKRSPLKGKICAPVGLSHGADGGISCSSSGVPSSPAFLPGSGT